MEVLLKYQNPVLSTVIALIGCVYYGGIRTVSRWAFNTHLEICLYVQDFGRGRSCLPVRGSGFRIYLSVSGSGLRIQGLPICLGP